MNSRIFILSKTEVKILLAAGIIGGILQIVCWNYLKNHPELLEDDNSEKIIFLSLSKAIEATLLFK